MKPINGVFTAVMIPKPTVGGNLMISAFNFDVFCANMCVIIGEHFYC